MLPFETSLEKEEGRSRLGKELFGEKPPSRSRLHGSCVLAGPGRVLQVPRVFLSEGLPSAERKELGLRFDELPLLLKLADVERLAGLDRRQVGQLVDSKVLEVVRMNQSGIRYYTRESVKQFLNVKGQEQVPD